MAIIGRSVVNLWKVERSTGKQRIIAEAEPPHSATCKDWALASLPVLIHPWISSWATWITAFIKYMRKLIVIVSSFMCHIGKIFPAANWHLKEQTWAKKTRLAKARAIYIHYNPWCPSLVRSKAFLCQYLLNSLAHHSTLRSALMQLSCE